MFMSPTTNYFLSGTVCSVAVLSTVNIKTTHWMRILLLFFLFIYLSTCIILYTLVNLNKIIIVMQ